MHSSLGIKEYFMFKVGDSTDGVVYMVDLGMFKAKPASRAIRKGSFKCNCGELFTASVYDVKSGNTGSCGCKGQSKLDHLTEADKKLYAVWVAMKQRCYNPNSHRYYNYGARGIRVDPTWVDSFLTFLSDMGSKPSSEYSLDRLDGDKDYTPENCRWATPEEQASNTRSNRVLEYKGESYTLNQLSRHVGIPANTLHYRMLNMGIEEAVNHKKFATSVAKAVTKRDA